MSVRTMSITPNPTAELVRLAFITDRILSAIGTFMPSTAPARLPARLTYMMIMVLFWRSITTHGATVRSCATRLFICALPTTISDNSPTSPFTAIVSGSSATIQWKKFTASINRTARVISAKVCVLIKQMASGQTKRR